MAAGNEISAMAAKIYAHHIVETAAVIFSAMRRLKSLMRFMAQVSHLTE
jgi:hypothetical protein